MKYQFGLLWGGTFGVIVVLLLELNKLLLFHQHIVLLSGVKFGLVFALLAAVAFWTHNGGLTWYKHVVLRFLLWRTHCFPWKAVPFLEDATHRILLQRFGGGYRFFHDLLRDHFAPPTPASSTPPPASCRPPPTSPPSV